MNNDKKCCGSPKKVIPGITCEVANCQYHESDGHCTAGHIKVGPHAAHASAETLCTTFKNKAE